jgi:hypothetical protein
MLKANNPAPSKVRDPGSGTVTFWETIRPFQGLFREFGPYCAPTCTVPSDAITEGSMALNVHVQEYTPFCEMGSGFPGRAVAQTNAPPLLPQPLLLELKLPVVSAQLLNADGAAVKVKPLIVPLGAKPRSTDPMKSFFDVVAPVAVIVSVADVEVMSNW